MKDNYYTPTKEEFYIGFECEVYDDDDNTWDLVHIDTQPDLCNITGLDLDIRVKYLDRSDIEDLGFKQLDRVNASRYIKDNVSIWLGDCTNGMVTKIEVRDRLRAIGSTKLFIGDVKNKSELKILLKQLNIQ